MSTTVMNITTVCRVKDFPLCFCKEQNCTNVDFHIDIYLFNYTVQGFKRDFRTLGLETPKSYEKTNYMQNS